MSPDPQPVVPLQQNPAPSVVPSCTSLLPPGCPVLAVSPSDDDTVVSDNVISDDEIDGPVAFSGDEFGENTIF